MSEKIIGTLQSCPMSSGEDRRAAEVRLSDETIEYLERHVRNAVSQGIKTSMSEEAALGFWRAGVKALQQHASEEAGKFVIGGILGLIKRLALFLMLGGLVYAAGGWSALAALFKVLFGAGHS